MLLGLSCWAQDVDSNPVEFKFKVYLESDGNNVMKANDLNIRVDETFDHGFRDFKESSGKFSIDISANKQFIVFLSADGYETKSVLLSTVGFQSGDKHIFRVNITLNRIGNANYMYPNPSAFVKYDYIDTAEFVILNEDALVSHLVKR